MVVKVEKKLKIKTKKAVKIVAVKVGVIPLTEDQAQQWIINHEGGRTSVNPTSLACGQPQALPCSKLLRFAHVDLTKYNLSTYAGTKAAISTVSVATQRAWMDLYVHQRYRSYLNAYRYWVVHHCY